ncbi:GH92 family glycosyl hydrolase [Terriglobus roseus]|uniref:Alpha-1,2-mannosidase, putative n=1 Tax=Terriglobus roseus TaxID=392734 RepID=A0A1H4MD30_9BACT|nr:GH92 family glycosyl hydrolase [Terriglobus roseus]SEB80242.1 alpha-1,2-mannosidase, putative [Terriglobus roseus]
MNITKSYHRVWLCCLALAACVFLTPANAQAPVAQTLVSDVDPFIGTGPEGHTFPGATVPFGMVQLSPDTQIRPFKQSYKWAAGYRYEDTTILGFSHTHFSGAGHSDLGDVLLQPISGDVRLEPGDIDKPESGYRSKFSHTSEKASPGYYAVTLEDYGIRAELTASARVGVHRYKYPAGKSEHVLLDLRSSIYNYPGKVLWSRVRVRADGTITGVRETRGWAPGRQQYFAMRFSQPMASHELYDREPLPVEYKGFKTPGSTPQDTQSIEGRGLIGVFDFASSSEPLVVKVALSSVSEDNAIANMTAEVPAFDFESVHAAAAAQWQNALSVIEITAPEPVRKSLYTAMYHALLAPSLSMDVDGSYRGPDNQVHKANGFHYVSSLSLWDTYRAEQPLMTLLQPPDRTSDLVNSLIASQQESPFGILPVWQFQGIETWCMIGYHAVPIIADAYLKGIKGFDEKAALNAMVASANYAPYGNLGTYMKQGYVPVDNDGEAASKTVEYAFDDWTIARTAAAMHRKDVASTFYKRAGYWRNNFNTADGFVEPRLVNGDYRKPFDPTKAGANSGFTEGNAWQYSWYQPQDEQGLIGLLGGPDRLVAKLDEMFDQKVDPAKYADVEDISGMIGQYIHGNEPSHHLPYLYMYAGQPWRTQARLKQIIDTQYKPAPDGLVGNDDLGQMSAWFVFTSLGFYPVAPGSNQYVLGRPFVDRAVLHLPNGKTLTIVADRLTETNAFVQSVTLNGKALDRSFVTHQELMSGGELRFVMSPKDKAAWSLHAQQPPYSMSTAK